MMKRLTIACLLAAAHDSSAFNALGVRIIGNERGLESRRVRKDLTAKKRRNAVESTAAASESTHIPEENSLGDAPHEASVDPLLRKGGGGGDGSERGALEKHVPSAAATGPSWLFGIEPSPEVAAIMTVYFVQGILGIASLATTFFLKDELGTATRAYVTLCCS